MKQLVLSVASVIALTSPAMAEIQCEPGETKMDCVSRRVSACVEVSQPESCIVAFTEDMREFSEILQRDLEDAERSEIQHQYLLSLDWCNTREGDAKLKCYMTVEAGRITALTNEHTPDQ